MGGTSRVIGISELSMRLPAIVVGAALGPVMYGAAKAAFDRRTARVAALLVVPAPFLVWYSQEARMYSLFMLIGVAGVWAQIVALRTRSEEHTSELQSLMRISYAVFCLKKKKIQKPNR